MLTEDAVKFFGNKTKLAEAAGVSPASVSRWGKQIPERRAARLDRLTDGELSYDPAAYQHPKSTDAA